MISNENGIYAMAVVGINGLRLGTGTSTTKKQAEQWAAREALLKWQL
jgi:dsRNA-specific ribonuclease